MNASLHRHAPPAVRYPVGRSPRLALGLWLVVLASAAVLGGWTYGGAGGALWRPGLAWGLWAASALAVLHFWRHQVDGDLCWDGAHWWFDAGLPGGQGLALHGPLEVHLDLQSCLWLSVRPLGRGRRWFWVERQAQPARWSDVRRAVYSRAASGSEQPHESASPRRHQA
ncbi:MAG: hypothetical protein PHI55_10360 [Burkholderiaceae bacterium]|nr:hypothetical protein [Burkholderiaceae bacterium]